MHGDHNLVFLPLPKIKPQNVRDAYVRFYKAVRIPESTRELLRILRFLWRDIVGPVADKLDMLGFKQGSRIWWCPTSYLGMLPLHAAGPYREGKLNLPDL